MWIKWQTSPVTMDFTEKEETIAAIPFPTVTICPETKANKLKIDIVSTYHAMKENINVSEIE